MQKNNLNQRMSYISQVLNVCECLSEVCFKVMVSGWHCRSGNNGLPSPHQSF